MFCLRLADLDAFGMDDPDNKEPQPEDRCSVCEHPLVDHPARGGRGAKWAHRRAAFSGLVLARL